MTTSVEPAARAGSGADLTRLAGPLRAARAGTAWRGEGRDRKLRRARRLGVALPADAGEQAVEDALERVLDHPDFLPWHWLQRAAEVAESVGRIDGLLGDGTGVLVSRELLLTNHHVLDSPATAEAATVTFRYQQDPSGNITGVCRHRLDPARCFVTSPVGALDYALVAVAPEASGAAPGDEHGWVPLHGVTGKILVGERVNIVQHPSGRPKELVVRDNRLLSLDDERELTYSTDTEAGSSGAPVFNDQWEMVALHRRSVEATDAAGTRLDRNGEPVTAATPEHLRRWVANAGIRVSALVADLTAGDHAGEARVLVDRLLAPSPTPPHPDPPGRTSP